MCQQISSSQKTAVTSFTAGKSYTQTKSDLTVSNVTTPCVIQGIFNNHNIPVKQMTSQKLRAPNPLQPVMMSVGSLILARQGLF